MTVDKAVGSFVVDCCCFGLWVSISVVFVWGRDHLTTPRGVELLQGMKRGPNRPRSPYSKHHGTPLRPPPAPPASSASQPINVSKTGARGQLAVVHEEEEKDVGQKRPIDRGIRSTPPCCKIQTGLRQRGTDPAPVVARIPLPPPRSSLPAA